MTLGLKKWAANICVRALLFPIVAAVKITSRMTGSAGKGSLREEIEDGVSKLSQLIRSSLRLPPTRTGDGSYIDNTPPEPSLIDDLKKVGIKDLDTLVDIVRNAATGEPVDDRDYILERVIQVIFKAQGKRFSHDIYSDYVARFVFTLSVAKRG